MKTPSAGCNNWTMTIKYAKLCEHQFSALSAVSTNCKQFSCVFVNLVKNTHWTSEFTRGIVFNKNGSINKVKNLTFNENPHCLFVTQERMTQCHTANKTTTHFLQSNMTWFHMLQQKDKRHTYIKLEGWEANTLQIYIQVHPTKNIPVWKKELYIPNHIRHVIGTMLFGESYQNTYQKLEVTSTSKTQTIAC